MRCLRDYSGGAERKGKSSWNGVLSTRRSELDDFVPRCGRRFGPLHGLHPQKITLNSSAKIIFLQRENGYIAHPIPTPTKRKRNSDHTMYFTRSIGRRRLRKPNAMEISSAKSSMDWKWLRLNPIPAFILCVLVLLHTRAVPPADSAHPPSPGIASRNRRPRARRPPRSFRATWPPDKTFPCPYPPNNPANRKHRSRLN